MVGMEHERMRIRTMTDRQLWTRLGKMFIHRKLSDFAEAAIEAGKPALSVAAVAKLAELHGQNPAEMGRTASLQRKLADSGHERLLRRMDA